MATLVPARQCVAISCQVHDLNRPFSNFRFIEEHIGAPTPPIQRLFSQVRALQGKTLVIEELGPASDLQEENHDLLVRDPGFVPGKAWRLAFFSKGFGAVGELQGVGDNDFLGYAVLRCDKATGQTSRTRVYESVLRPSSRANNHIRGGTVWSCRIADHEAAVPGYVYAQQNNLTNVCAHVALRTAAATFADGGDMSYRKMNELLGIDHVTRKVGRGCKGLALAEMATVLEAAGARCFLADYSAQPPTGLAEQTPFQKWIYGSVESGFPAIVVFAAGTSSHAIPVIGHTFNEDTWVPNADLAYFHVGSHRYIPSESWVSMYIGHDDNLGSNYCIPRHYLHVQRWCEHAGAGGNQAPCKKEQQRVAAVVSTFPKDVLVDPIQAEVIGYDYLCAILQNQPALKQGAWIQRFVTCAKLKRLVMRPILVKGADYLRHLQTMVDWDGSAFPPNYVAALRRFLGDKWLWLVELSIPELFPANRRKLAEVLLRADLEPGKTRDFGSFVVARLPGHVALLLDAQKQEFSFFPTSLSGHVPLYGCEDVPPQAPGG